MVARPAGADEGTLRRRTGDSRETTGIEALPSSTRQLFSSAAVQQSGSPDRALLQASMRKCEN